MKVEGWLFAAGIFFFWPVALIYWLLSSEPAGTTALTLTGGLAFLIGFYVLFTGRQIGVRPEDRLDGEIDEAAGEVGFFSPHSWWPLACGLGAVTVSLGIIYGWWLVIVGVALLAYAVLGMVFEYYRDNHPERIPRA